MLIPTHTLFGVAALATGAFVLVRRKGDRLHRLAGWTYAVSMLLLCVGSFWIRDTTPFYRGFGPFHVAAFVSLFTLIWGISASRWASGAPEAQAAGHVRAMVWSYIGLLMATGSHAISPVGRAFRDGLGLTPGTAFPLAFLLCWGIPPLVGVLLLRQRVDRLESLFASIKAAKANP